MGSPSTEVKTESSIVEKDGKFYFLDETWNEGGGPYDTREEAQQEQRRYVAEVLDGKPYESQQKGS